LGWMWITFTFKNWTYMSYIFHKRGTCFIERDMIKMFVSGLEIE
jgi:hypothetical protein